MSAPFIPGAPTMMGGGVPPELAQKAGNMQLYGILSIPLVFCCGIASIVLSIMVLVQSGGVLAELARYGSPPELVGKVKTGKTCAIVGLVVFGVAFCGGIIAQIIIAGMAANH